MRSLSLIFTLVFLSGCVMESTIATRESLSTDDDSRDHSGDDPITKDPNSLPLIVRSNSSQVTTKISESLIIPVRIKAQDNFRLDSVSVSVDVGDIDQKYTKINLDKQLVDITAGEEKLIGLGIITETMSASFKDKNVRVTFSNSQSDSTPIHYDFKLTVLPEVEIKLLKGGSPHIYSLPNKNKICFRAHETEDGPVDLKVTFKNQSDDFEAGVLDWRLHSAGRFRHSSGSEVIRKGGSYTPNVQNANSNRAPFYNHTNGSGDNRSRELYFKVAVGDEENVCDE